MMSPPPAGTHSVLAIEGRNFSGRSDALHRLTKQGLEGARASSPPKATRANTYVGVDAQNYLSGLLPTLRGELELHGIVTSPRRCAVEAVLATGNLSNLAARNPVTLSGGQQVILAIATALLSTREILAIDCSLEQLSPENRTQVLQALGRPDLHGVQTILADNRLLEFRDSVSVQAGLPDVSEPATSVPVMLADILATIPTSAQPLGLEGVNFSYQSGKPVFRNLTCQFDPGYVHFIVGPNGVGKSSLGKLLCGLFKPHGGSLWVGNHVPWQPWLNPGRSVAYHFQNPDLQLFRTRVADVVDASDEVTEAFGLTKFLSEHPLDLPFVLRKRLAIASTVARRRPWLILDEPILGQDDSTARILARILDRAAASGAGIIVITHSKWFRSLVARPRLLTLHPENEREEQHVANSF